MNRRSLVAGTGGLLGAALAGHRPLRAQGNWPNRPVRLVVGWPPGGSVDTLARILQPRWQQLLGQPLVVENKGGASGSIGAVEVARAAPDGNTWLLAYDTQATNETVMQLPFQTLRDLAPVSLVASGPLALVAHRDAPYRSFAEVVEAAKRAPDSISYASSGVGGLSHVAMTRLQQQGGFRLTHVPYRGAGPATQDAVAGHVPLFMTNIVPIAGHVRAGTLRPLGVTTAGESRFLPGTPSFAQQGFGGFEAPTWWALLAPARTPEPILARMHEVVTTVLREPEIRAKFEEQGAEVVASSPAECDRFLREEISKWGQVIRDNNIRADS
ncbi:tripartite tricarboxylate transporter substrate binding protein [Roseomonas sp. BN140053]|uniref:tripartite tricarboxylate transporter substrate binding protein n=1 Tax=Roseomonas sp. BN140053 TaxID=3391898 RepID=UPI0039E89EDA